MKAKTKITIEMTGYTFSAEIDHDANIDEMVDIFKALLISHMFSEKTILDAFYKHSFTEDYEVID